MNDVLALFGKEVGVLINYENNDTTSKIYFQDELAGVLIDGDNGYIFSSEMNFRSKAKGLDIITLLKNTFLNLYYNIKNDYFCYKYILYCK